MKSWIARETRSDRGSPEAMSFLDPGEGRPGALAESKASPESNLQTYGASTKGNSPNGLPASALDAGANNLSTL